MINYNLKLPEKIELLLQEIQTDLKRILGENIDKIILYGSYSFGNFTDESDIDIMVLLKSSNNVIYKNKISDIVVDLSLKHEIVVSIMVEKTTEYFKRIEYVPFFQNVNKGMVIYAS